MQGMFAALYSLENKISLNIYSPKLFRFLIDCAVVIGSNNDRYYTPLYLMFSFRVQR